MTAPRELRTARLLLRSFTHEDLTDLVRLAGAREIAATTANIPHPYTAQDAVNFLAHAEEELSAGNSAIFAVVTLPASGVSSGELCGAVGLTIAPRHHRAELGYWIGLPYWGRGFATEAAGAVVAFGFDILGLHRIYAHHYAENFASGRVLEKIGMRHEGHLRQHIEKWGRFVDVENYGILAAEFRGRK